MARLWSCGFELNTLTANVEIGSSSSSGGASIAVSTNQAHSGTYALRSNNSGANGTASVVYQFSAADQNGKILIRAYIYVVARPAATATIINTTNIAQNNPSARIRMQADGSLLLTDGPNTTIGSASAVVPLNTWTLVELSVFNNTGSGKMELNAQLNGVSFASTTTDTNTATLGVLGIGVATSTSSYDIYFDDIAINDSSGGSQTSFPGAANLAYLRPSAAGDNNTFSTQVGGTAGAANNFTRVNEVTPNDATSYNADTVLNDLDDFNIDDTPTALGSNATINAVQVGVRYAAAIASAEAAFKLRVKKASGGTVSKSAEITPSSTSYTSNANAAPFNHPLTLYQDPDASNWTKTTLDSAQIGYEISTGNTNAARISNVWMIVDYTPGSSPSASPSSSVSASPSSSVSSSPSRSPSSSISASPSSSQSPSSSISPSPSSSTSPSPSSSSSSSPSPSAGITASSGISLLGIL